jgi:hypothetical protein
MRLWWWQREQEEEEARIREEEETLAAVKMKHLRLQEERREQDRIALAEQQAARADKVRRPATLVTQCRISSLLLPSHPQS